MEENDNYRCYRTMHNMIFNFPEPLELPPQRTYVPHCWPRLACPPSYMYSSAPVYCTLWRVVGSPISGHRGAALTRTPAAACARYAAVSVGDAIVGFSASVLLPL